MSGGKTAHGDDERREARLTPLFGVSIIRKECGDVEKGEDKVGSRQVALDKATGIFSDAVSV